MPTLNAPASLDAFAPGTAPIAINGISVADVDLANGIAPGETDFMRFEVQVLDNTDTRVAAAQLNYTAADPTSGGATIPARAPIRWWCRAPKRNQRIPDIWMVASLPTSCR